MAKRSPGKGIQVTPSGYRAAIRIDGVLHRQHFPPGTDLVEIRKWLLKTEIRYRGKKAKRTGWFDDDARVYLETVRAMPTFAQRTQHVEEWIAVFGRRRRATITAADIAAQLHRWRSEPRQVTKKGSRTVTLTLSAAAVNKRRTALMHLFSVLDGKAAENPVRDVPRFAEPAPAPRAIPFNDLARVFAAMPDSRSKAHLMVTAYTGLPPGQVMTLTPEQVRGSTVAVQGRRKGKGTRGKVLPLIPQAVEAFALMARLDAWGTIRVPVLSRALRRACKAVGLAEHWRVYDLRHSFASEVYRRTGDIRAVQILLDHSSPTLTQRYTVAAEDPRVQAAVDKF